MHRLRKNVLVVAMSFAFAFVTATGVGAGTAHADVIDDLAAEYSLGAGAGHIANLLNESVTLRSQGFGATRRQLTAIRDALGYRPNQQPLAEALESAVISQRRLLAESQVMAGGGPAPTVNACDFNNQWNVRQRQGGMPWPPIQQFCRGPFTDPGGVIIGGGQTIQAGTGGGQPADGAYKIGNGR